MGVKSRIFKKLKTVVHRKGSNDLLSKIGSAGGKTEVLILTRRIGESVKIEGDITVTVLGMKGNQVRLGIDAPKSVSVFREEIYERIQNEQSTSTEE